MITVYVFGRYTVDWNGSAQFTIRDRYTGREVAVFTDGIPSGGKYEAAAEAQQVVETYWAGRLLRLGDTVEYEVLRMGDDCEDQWISGTVTVPVLREGRVA